MSWHEWTARGVGGKSRTTTEAIVELGNNPRVHLFYGAETAAELAELAGIAASLRIVVL